MNGTCVNKNCEGGKIIDNKCKCPEGFKERYGECEKIKCAGGIIKGVTCICPKDNILLYGKCVKKVKCVGGHLINNRCLVIIVGKFTPLLNRV